jgi:hypothetical protein
MCVLTKLLLWMTDLFNLFIRLMLECRLSPSRIMEGNSTFEDHLVCIEGLQTCKDNFDSLIVVEPGNRYALLWWIDYRK